MQRMAGNATASRILDTLKSHLVRLQYRVILLPGRPQASLAEHRAIVDALCKRDGDAAEAAMRRHLESFIRLLETGDRRRQARRHLNLAAFAAHDQEEGASMSEQKTGLVVTAHPGDFVWRAGGAIALHAKQGYRMKIVCLSFGERGESQFAWKEAGATLESVKAGRKDEAERAAALLGAEIEFFDCGDYPLKLNEAAFRPHGRHLPRNQSGFRADARA